MSARMRAIPVGILATSLLLVGGPASAQAAKKPPKGAYMCEVRSVSGILPSGTLKIASKSRYVVAKKPGKFRMKGRKMVFRSGLYKKWDYRARYRPASSKATDTIIIRNDPEDRSRKMYCYRAKD